MFVILKKNSKAIIKTKPTLIETPKMPLAIFEWPSNTHSSHLNSNQNSNEVQTFYDSVGYCIIFIEASFSIKKVV